MYAAAKTKTGSVIGDLANTNVDLGSGGFDMTNALGGGACVPDLSITVMGNTQTIGLSRVCDSLVWLGNILVAVALIAGAGIVFKGGV